MRFAALRRLSLTALGGAIFASSSRTATVTAAAFVCPSARSCAYSSFRISSMSSNQKSLATALSMSSDGNSDFSSSATTLRVLALHGSEGTGEGIIETLGTLSEAVKQKDPGIKLEVIAIDAPFPKGDGFAWWTMPAGVRSFNAESYTGFEQSSKLVLDAVMQNPDEPIDLIIGHSQGAILLSAILALDQIPYHPSRGYILNGVAFPNPYAQQLEALRIALPDNFDDSSQPQQQVKELPRVLFVMGEKDRINPPSSAMQVREALEKANLRVETVTHPGGHSFPSMCEDSMQTIAGWLLADN